MICDSPFVYIENKNGHAEPMMVTLRASYRKARSSSLPAAFCFNIHPQSSCFCVISRLAYFSCFVGITFVVLITQKFTFVNYTSYVSSSISKGNIFSEKFVNIPEKETAKLDEVTDDWIKVTDDVYIYSAYWDNRVNNESFVRIIGGIRYVKYNLNSTKCLLKYNSTTVSEILSDVEILIEHHNKPSKAVYIKCLANTNELPSHVALVAKEWNNTWLVQPSWVTVHFLNNTLLHDVGVCVRPMFNFTDVFMIAEFIAFYEALGVTHFTFYNYDISVEVINFFHSLKSEKYSIEVLPWSLPSSLKSMWAVGQMASINDCLYRSMGKITYTVIVDLDEFITPRHAMTLLELMKLQDDPKRHSAGFVLRSTIFCSEYEQDKLPAVIPPFKSQSHIRRDNYIYPFLIRTKYIVKPLKVEVGGIHHVWKFIPEWDERYIPASKALVHHYRSDICVAGKTLDKGQIDVKARKYLNQLMRSKAVEVWKRMFSNQ